MIHAHPYPHYHRNHHAHNATQTGVHYVEKESYTFQEALSVADFQDFMPRIKQLKGLPRPRMQRHLPQALEEEYQGYQLSRHLNSLGPTSKLARTNVTAVALCETAAFFNATGRAGDARVYSQAALAVSSKYSVHMAMAYGQLIQAQLALEAQSPAPSRRPGPSDVILRLYQEGLAAFEWHWGFEHPLTVFLHDLLAESYFADGQPDRALQLHARSLQIVRKELGDSHLTTAGYFVKVGWTLVSAFCTLVSAFCFLAVFHVTYCSNPLHHRAPHYTPSRPRRRRACT
jgi:hypothetical protein